MKNIIIAGGGLVNKGAQAMTLITVCELKKRYPRHRIYLLTWNASAEEKKRHEMYALELLTSPPLKFANAAKNPVIRKIYALRYGKLFKVSDEIYRNADLFIDISGYALGSDWSDKICNDYLNCIEFALKYNVPVYLLPQSFGPFDFKGTAGEKTDRRIRRILPRVRLVCAREREGYDALRQKYGLQDNLILCNDIVLNSSITDFSPAFTAPHITDIPDIASNSVCVIPNVRLESTGNKHIKDIYISATNAALDNGFNVYITHHSSHDKELCKEIKEAFAENSRVILLDKDFDCIEFNSLIVKFKFVIASRYHSLVHSLKNGVPCVAIGWAVKYAELMNSFNQNQYMLDARNDIAVDDIVEKVNKLSKAYSSESFHIQRLLSEIQGNSVFDKIIN